VDNKRRDEVVRVKRNQNEKMKQRLGLILQAGILVVGVIRIILEVVFR
jgi:hypothetical protein